MLDEHSKIVLTDFIEERWAAFQHHCEEHGADPDDVIDSLKEPG